MKPLNCWFCGSSTDVASGYAGPYVRCDNKMVCGVRGPNANTPEDAIRLWNGTRCSSEGMVLALNDYVATGNMASLAVVLDQERDRIDAEMDRIITKEDIIRAGAIEDEEHPNWVYHLNGYRISQSWYKEDKYPFRVSIWGRSETKSVHIRTVRDLQYLLHLFREDEV